MKRTVMFIFAGREKYMAVQMNYLRKILNRQENIELHIWNFSRNSDDNEYLQGLPKQSEKIKLFNEFYEGDNTETRCVKRPGFICQCVRCRPGKWTEPYKYYATSSDYDEETVFVKIDDDIVYIDEIGFDLFVKEARLNKDDIYSANVINNGICSFYDENLKAMVLKRTKLRCVVNGLPQKFYKYFYKRRYLEAWWRLCTDADYFRVCHDYFLENFQEIKKNKKIGIGETLKSRFSINALAISHKNMAVISALLLGEPSRNDESLISRRFNIKVFNGFIVSHLHFADQRAAITDLEESFYLSKYRNITGATIL